MIMVIMGVSGCGKTTLGEQTAEQLKIDYFEADAFHPQANIDKMSAGTPLNDTDRWPWLELIREKMNYCMAHGKSAVFSCSALKETYRGFLAEGLPEPLTWVYLKGDFDIIFQRLQQRKGHYQKADMLKSQFADLEEPQYGTILDINVPLDEKVEKMVALFRENLSYNAE